MKVIFISGREPGYARNRVILKGLRKNKVLVHECTSTSRSYPIRLISVLLKLLFAKKDADIIFVGFFGQPLVPIIRLFTKKPLVFDAFISAYDTLVDDRKSIKNGFAANILKWLDKKSCKDADIILLDTNSHIDYFVREFNLPKKKFRRVLVGTDDIFYPRINFNPRNNQNNSPPDIFVVSFHGAFIPLQGTDHIIQAIKILEKNKAIIFNILGSGQTFTDEIKSMPNVQYQKWLPYEKLPDFLSKADVCLGIFGTTPKANRVIPNKVYEALAMKKPIITMESYAIKELLDNKSAIMCKPGDAKAITDAILNLKKNKKLRESIALQGYKIFKKRATTEIIGKEIKEICEYILVNKK